MRGAFGLVTLLAAVAIVGMLVTKMGPPTLSPLPGDADEEKGVGPAVEEQVQGDVDAAQERREQLEQQLEGGE